MVTQADIPKEYVELYQMFKRRPDFWIEQILNCKLWERQKEIAISVAENPRTTVRSAEAVGKSFLAARIALWFLYNFHPSTVLTTSPSFRQVVEVIWRELKTAYASQQPIIIEGVPHSLTGDLLDFRLNVSENEKHFALGMSTDMPERFLGFHNDYVLVIGDDASGLNAGVYNAIENPLATGHTRLLLISNPTQPVGEFRDTFNSPIYRSFHISAFDTPNFTHFGLTIEDMRDDTWKLKMGVTDEQLMDGTWRRVLPFPQLVAAPRVAERMSEWGEGSYQFQCFVMGEFPEEGVNNLFRFSDVERAVDAEYEQSNELVAALDVARYGGDKTVYLLRRGGRVLKVDKWIHADIQFTVGRCIRHLIEDHPRVIRVDASGIGQDDAALLRSEGFNVEEIFVGSPAIDKERFLNKRAELYWQLQKLFLDGRMSIPNDRELIGQLSDLRYTYKQGRMMIESKEDARSRGSKSPDIADALMLSIAPSRKLTAAPVWDMRDTYDRRRQPRRGSKTIKSFRW